MKRTPWLPFSRIAHLLQQPVVLGLISRDEAAQVEDGNVQQAASGKVQDVDDPADATVPVGERVDALELMVDDCHPRQRVEVTLFAAQIDEPFKGGHEVAHRVCILRRDIDKRARPLVLEGCSGGFAKTAFGALEDAEHRDNHVVGQQAAEPLLLIEAMQQRIAIASHLLRGRCARVFGEGVDLEQLVLRRDDVLNLRTGFRLLER